jgi:hypothetical protein
MNKKYIYWGVGLVAVGGLAFYFMRKKSAVTSENVEKLTVDKELAVEPVKGNATLEQRKSGKAKLAEAISGAKSVVSGTVKTVFKEKPVDVSVDPRLAEAVRLRDEADKIRNAKGFNNLRWRGALNGLRLNLAQQQFILGNRNTASTDEKLVAGQKALETAQRM